ncbi:serine protease 27-like [Enoplosus armatus]|uniref:serine protease 27-like n=1 Tax=Enoplosus armatus TaxID=215367 RepID=UPI0039937096
MIVLSSRGSQSQLPVCGLASKNTRIVGGQHASPGSWPWQASINTGSRQICAGSLITDQWVLTAAHCIEEYLKIVVYLGRHSQSGSDLNEVSRGLDQITCHPSFNFLTNDNDICLLKLSAPVNFTDYIYPICLASGDSTFHTGVNSWVTGWGVPSDILREVNVPIVGNNECKCTYDGLTENMICAGLRAGGKDACQGDSGGPLVSKNGSLWVQSGIVSFGEGCAEPMRPGGYTRVSEYQEWISNVTGSSKPGFVTFTSSGADSDSNFTCPTVPPTTTTTPTTTTNTTYTTRTRITCKNGNSVFDSGGSSSPVQPLPGTLGVVSWIFAPHVSLHPPPSNHHYQTARTTSTGSSPCEGAAEVALNR